MSSDLQEWKGSAGQNPWYSLWTGLIDETQDELNLRLEKAGGTVSGQLELSNSRFRMSGLDGSNNLIIRHSADDTDIILSWNRVGANNYNFTFKGTIVQESWISPTLLNSWVNHGGAGDASAGYYKDKQGTVWLRGRVKDGTVGSPIFNLPAGYRPATNYRFAVSSNGAFGYIVVQTTGDVLLASGFSNTWVEIACAFRAT